jgi:hypothetical protein
MRFHRDTRVISPGIAQFQQQEARHVSLGRFSYPLVALRAKRLQDLSIAHSSSSNVEQSRGVLGVLLTTPGGNSYRSPSDVEIEGGHLGGAYRKPAPT